MSSVIKDLYEALANQSLDLHKYSARLSDVAFEITTADTFIAGIASKILDQDIITSEERTLLTTPLLTEGHLWRCDNGHLFDLQPYAELLTAADAVEKLRSECNEVLTRIV